MAFFSHLFVWFHFLNFLPIIYCDEHWCYDGKKCGPDKWHGICASGKSQSPIDIPSAGGMKKSTGFQLNDRYLVEKKHMFYGQNNGHTAQFEYTRNMTSLSSDLRICGGELPACYLFAQFHYHWDTKDMDGSEHSLNGKRYPLELHIVHYKEKYSSLTKALESDDKEAVAVMGIFYEIGEDDNIHLSSVITALDMVKLPGAVKDFHLDLNIAEFYPSNKDFARYPGSLTTPSCDEKVVWTVFLSPNTISRKQMMKFREIRDTKGISSYNFRPIQPLHDRKILFFQSGNFTRVSTAAKKRN